MKNVWLQENKWEDVEHYLSTKKTILVPFGSVEQHAQHLPMGTDAFVAQKVAEEAGKRTNTLVAPLTWYGWAPHHMAYPGTVTLRPETLTAVVEDVCQSLIYHGFEKIILVNGHREANLPPIKVAITRLRNKTGAFLAIADPFYLNSEKGKELRKSEPGGLGHAEELETSHMYYLHPDLCNPDRAGKNIPEKHRFLQHDPYVEGDRVFSPSDVNTYRAVTEQTGLVGDATPASEETGQKYHEALVANLKELIKYCDEDVTITLRNQSIPL